MYSCVDGNTCDIVKGGVFCLSFELRLPVVSILKANNVALFPMIPSLNIISMFCISLAGMLSGQPPCAQTYARAC